MSEAREVVFYSARQVDAEQKFLERQRQPAEYWKYLPIIIVLTILFGALSIVLGLWQGAPVAALVSAL
jgi:fatty acid desaturase